MMQPATSDLDPQYIGIHRILLHRKAESGVISRRYDWRCNGKGYIVYRNFISRPRKWENLRTPSLLSNPGNSGRWLPSPSPLAHQIEAESFTSSRDLRSVNQVSSHRASFSSSLSDGDHSYRGGGGDVEHAYSFVGMHCIFDQCKSSVTVLKFGHMSSDLLAYGASDGSLTVCNLSEDPSVLKQLTGHSKDVTGNMEPNKEDNVSLAPTAQITAAPILQDASSQPGVFAIPPVVPPSFPPPMAPIPMMPHPPVARPPTFRPPVSQNGGAKTSDSDSESEDEQYEISKESKLVRER